MSFLDGLAYLYIMICVEGLSYMFILALKPSICGVAKIHFDAVVLVHILTRIDFQRLNIQFFRAIGQYSIVGWVM
jgi:hypothetical protein